MQTRYSIYFALFAILLLAVGVVVRSHASQQSNPPSNSSKRPVIVELFTSEGCSSCPPADALLKQLSDRQPVPGAEVIALEEHVDYWNQLGWTDPYSSPEFSERQERYASALHNGGVFTPQMIVDGTSQFVGSRGLEARAAIQRAATEPKAAITLTQTSPPGKTSATFNLQLEPFPAAQRGAQWELWLAVTEKNLQTDVKAGENSGETLQHADIVRKLRKLESVHPDAASNTQFTLDLQQSWKLANVRVVAFVVDKASHHIVGAASTPLAN